MKGLNALLLLMALPLLIPMVHAQSASEQIVFSGVGVGSWPASPLPFPVNFGFWIWCEDPESSNSYAGLCAGAMYFYGILPPPGSVFVSGTVTEPTPGVHVMNVASRAGSLLAVACTLTNPLPAKQGPTNTVNVVCSAPPGTGTSTNAVVAITGP